MTTALRERIVIASAREALFELTCAVATVFALFAASEWTAWLTFWPAILVSSVGIAALAYCEPAALDAGSIWPRLRPWIVLAVAMLALSRLTTSEMAQAALWLPLAAAVILRLVPRQRIVTLTSSTPKEAAPATPVATEPSNGGADRQHHVEHVQSFDAGGLRRVTGVARLTFQPGERQVDVHLAFCPSFCAAPQLDCHQLSGSKVRIKLVQVMPYGARLEVQRTDAAAWAVVIIDFTAKVADEQPGVALARKAS